LFFFFLFLFFGSAVQYAGFTVTPIIGALVSWIGKKCYHSTHGYLNEYSSPAIFLILITLFEILLLSSPLFVDIPREASSVSAKEDQVTNSMY
jgi:multisubunit Na+/H+ antiporter MnhE subunit